MDTKKEDGCLKQGFLIIFCIPLIIIVFSLIIIGGTTLIGEILRLLPWYVWIGLGVLSLYLLHEAANKRT